MKIAANLDYTNTVWNFSVYERNFFNVFYFILGIFDNARNQGDGFCTKRVLAKKYISLRTI